MRTTWPEVWNFRSRFQKVCRGKFFAGFIPGHQGMYLLAKLFSGLMVGSDCLSNSVTTGNLGIAHPLMSGMEAFQSRYRMTSGRATGNSPMGDYAQLFVARSSSAYGGIRNARKPFSVGRLIPYSSHKVARHDQGRYETQNGKTCSDGSCRLQTLPDRNQDPLVMGCQHGGCWPLLIKCSDSLRKDFLPHSRDIGTLRVDCDSGVLALPLRATSEWTTHPS